MRLKWKNGCAGTARNPSDLCPWHMDETYVKVNCLLGVSVPGPLTAGPAVHFYFLPSNSKAAYRFWQSLQREEWQIRDSSTRIKRPPMVARLLRQRELPVPVDVEHTTDQVPEQRD